MSVVRNTILNLPIEFDSTKSGFISKGKMYYWFVPKDFEHITVEGGFELFPSENAILCIIQITPEETQFRILQKIARAVDQEKALAIVEDPSAISGGFATLFKSSNSRIKDVGMGIDGIMAQSIIKFVTAMVEEDFFKETWQKILQQYA